MSSNDMPSSDSVHEGTSFQDNVTSAVHSETSFQNANSVLDKKDVMATDLERVQKVIRRFKAVIIELSALVTADIRTFRTEEFQTLSQEMSIALNQLLHMIEVTEEVFTADDFMIVAQQVKKQKEVRGKVLVILLRGHRVLLEVISKSLTTESIYAESACILVEAAVSKMESILPRSTVKVPSCWECMFGCNN